MTTRAKSKPLRLTDLRPQFIQLTDTRGSYRPVNTLGDADGLTFLCPRCFKANHKNAGGVHAVICWFEGRVPDDIRPRPGRWTPGGSTYADLSFVPGPHDKPHSVLLLGACGWHGFIANGNVTDA
jgi:hypothetical protein